MSSGRLRLSGHGTTLGAVSEASFIGRFSLAWRTFFRVLFDREFAANARRLGSPTPEPPSAPLVNSASESPVPSAPFVASAAPALQLLALLQRDARFVDFVKQDIAAFSDAQIGQAARLVHDGAAKVFEKYLVVQPILGGEEGKPITVEPGFDPDAIRLVGSVSGSAPYRGVLNHGGWRAGEVTLPELVADHDASVLAPAEVEV